MRVGTQGGAEALAVCRQLLYDEWMAGSLSGPLARQQAVSYGLVSTILQNYSDCKADHATRMQETANFQLGGTERLTVADDPQRALQENGGLADLWYVDDGDTRLHPILVPSYLQEFDVANAKVREERNLQKNGSHSQRKRLRFRASRMEVSRSAEPGPSPHSHSGKPDTWSGGRTATRTSSGRPSSNARKRSAVSGPADRICAPT